MPKDASKSKATPKEKAKAVQPPLRPMRTMSKVALAMGDLEVSVDEPRIHADEDACEATEDKQEGSSYVVHRAPVFAVSRSRWLYQESSATITHRSDYS